MLITVLHGIIDLGTHPWQWTRIPCKSPYLFLKTFAILLSKTRFISDTHSIITAGVSKNFSSCKVGTSRYCFMNIFIKNFQVISACNWGYKKDGNKTLSTE